MKSNEDLYNILVEIRDILKESQCNTSSTYHIDDELDISDMKYPIIKIIKGNPTIRNDKILGQSIVMIKSKK